MPATEADILTYGVQEIRCICEYFEFDNYNELLEHWVTLLQSMVRSNN